MKKILPLLTFFVIFSFSALASASIPRQEGVLAVYLWEQVVNT